MNEDKQIHLGADHRDPAAGQRRRADAICEAAQKPTMRFVAVKGEETQGAAMGFRMRALLIRQRTPAIKALRGQRAEFGQAFAQGAANAARPITIIDNPDGGRPE